MKMERSPRITTGTKFFRFPSHRQSEPYFQILCSSSRFPSLTSPSCAIRLFIPFPSAHMEHNLTGIDRTRIRNGDTRVCVRVSLRYVWEEGSKVAPSLRDPGPPLPRFRLLLSLLPPPGSMITKIAQEVGNEILVRREISFIDGSVDGKRGERHVTERRTERWKQDRSQEQRVWEKESRLIA